MCKGHEQAIQKGDGSHNWEETFHLTRNQKEANKNKIPFFNLQNMQIQKIRLCPVMSRVVGKGKL